MMHGTPKRLWIFSALVCLLTAGTASANPAIYQRTLRSTGWVLVPGVKQTSAGTCWLIDREHRLVMTCEHIVGTASEALVYFPCYQDGTAVAESGHYLRKCPPINGRVIARDEARDLALIQLRTLPPGLLELPLAPRSSQPGEVVHSIGNSGLGEQLADGSLWWYTRGNVRQVHRQKVPGPNGTRIVRMVETQSPVNRGDSGGPVVNDQGQLVGVTASYDTDERLVSQNVDVTEVRSFLHETLAAQECWPSEPEPSEGRTVQGAWKFVVADKDGAQVPGVGQFERDGTFMLKSNPADHGPKVRRGRYTYANGMLWLIFDHYNASVNLQWESSDRFVLGAGKEKTVFDRQDGKEVRARRDESR